jgi:hypothetical protein
VTAPANNDRRCYICNDPNHLSNACPQKNKNKQHAQSKLKANRGFMALFEASFPKPEDKECAQRMINAWDEDHICPSCIKACFFAHECNPKDIIVTQKVQNTISNSQILHYLEEAHNPHITHLQAINPVTFGTSFFLPTGGHSVGIHLPYGNIKMRQNRHKVTHIQFAKTIRNLTTRQKIVI